MVLLAVEAAAGTIALSVAVPVAAAMATAITFLFRTQRSDWEKYQSKMDNKLDECEKKHSLSEAQILKLTVEVGEMRGRLGMAEEVAADIHDIKVISDSMLGLLTAERKDDGGCS